jgi:hypothetical protein
MRKKVSMQEEAPANGLDARVGQLESANRRLLAVLCAAICLLFAAATRSPQPPELVSTRSLEIVDEAGKVQARLAATPQGPELQLLDADGVARASLGHGAEGTALYLRDAEGTTRVGVAQFAHGGGGFALHGEESKGGAVLYLKSGRGTLTFYGADGTVVSRVPGEP